MKPRAHSLHLLHERKLQECNAIYDGGRRHDEVNQEESRATVGEGSRVLLQLSWPACMVSRTHG